MLGVPLRVDHRAMVYGETQFMLMCITLPVLTTIVTRLEVTDFFQLFDARKFENF